MNIDRDTYSRNDQITYCTFSSSFQIIGFIVMIMARCGGHTQDTVPRDDSYYVGWVDNVSKNTNNTYMEDSTLIDMTSFGDMTGYGFFFISIVLLISAMFGERAPVQVN